MTLLRTVHPDAADGKVAEFYQRIADSVGYIPTEFHIFSVSPEMFEQQMVGMAYLLSHPHLRPEFIAMMRYIISGENNNKFCIDFNEAQLINMGMDRDSLRAAKADPDKIPLPDHERALLKFVLKAMKDPNSVRSDDIAHLRQQGWTDTDIYDALASGARHAATDVIFNAFKASSPDK